MGPTMIYALGGKHLSGQALGSVSELGLCSDQVKITPTFTHEDIQCNDFGPKAPPDVMARLADVRLQMTLIHYDEDVLDALMNESTGGGSYFQVLGNNFLHPAGMLAPNGTPLGGGRPMYMSGNHLVSIGVTSPDLGKSYTFVSCYMDEQPCVIPLGSEASQVEVTFRAIPYVPIYQSGDRGQSSIETFTVDGVPYSFTEPLSSGVQIWGRFDLNA